MKKNLFLFASAAVMLAACSNEEVVSLNSEDAISFRVAVDHSSSSRGQETTTGNLKKFYVTALEKITTTGESGDETTSYQPLFTNLLFEKNGNGIFVSNPIYKWSKKMELNFYAYGYNPGTKEMPAPGAENSLYGTGVTINGTKQTLNEFSPQAAIENQIDLVAATTTSKQTALNAAVSLTFDHILSEVQVVAKCSATTHQVLVKGIKYGNIKNKGNYTFSPSSWKLIDGESTSYSVLYFDEPINLNSTNYDHAHSGTSSDPYLYHDLSKSEKASMGYAILLPQELGTWDQENQFWDLGKDGVAPEGKTLATAQYIAVLCKIEAIDNGEITAPKFPITENHMVEGTDGYGWAYIPFHATKWPEWNMGHRYIYHLDFTDGAGFNEDGDPILNGEIRFTATVNKWIDHDIYKPENSNNQ